VVEFLGKTLLPPFSSPATSVSLQLLATTTLERIGV